MDSVSANAIKYETDTLGQFACIQVDTSVYDTTAVLKTAYWFTDPYYVFIQRDETGLAVELRLKDEPDSARLATACAEFMNRLLDQQTRQAVLSETRAVRDQLVKKAFFEGSAHGNPDQLITNEAFIPASGESVDEDLLRIGRETGG